MNRLFLLLTLPFLIFLLAACDAEQQPIAYGQANCAHCQMTVSDNRFGSELVTKTGKAYFFDSAECLIQYLQASSDINQKAKLLLVSDFSKPDNLVDAENATYLQSSKLPSPMGMYLTAYADKNIAERMQQDNGGKLMNWNEAMVAVQKNAKPE